MALIKEYTTNRGTVSYWVLGLLQIDNYSKTAYARLYGYQNKQQADMENPSAITTLEVNITPDIYEYYFGEDILKLEGVTPFKQAYLIFKDFNIKSETGEIYNFADAINDIKENE